LRVVKPATRSFYLDKIDAVVARIVTGLDGAMDLESLAADACLSPFHFHRVFRGMVGETPLELARRLRLERAAWQLVATEDSVTSIAFSAGYETHESFTRAFRAAYGVPPMSFRQQGRTRTNLAASCGVHFSAEGGLSAVVPRDTGGTTMQVEITTQPALRVGAVRHVGPYNQVNSAFARLGEIAARAGLFQLKGATMIGMYHDDPESTPPEKLRSDAGIIVPEGVALPDGIAEHRLPAGKYAKAVHRGPYDTLGDTWQRMMGEWLPASGHRVKASPSYERYLNDPRTAKPEDLITEILVPVE
jgi:AraC family transcriptional regulator